MKYFIHEECPWNAPNLYYADATTNSCVLTCPTTPSRYANDLTQTCVECKFHFIAVCPWDAVDTTKQTYYDNYYRRCTLSI